MSVIFAIHPLCLRRWHVNWKRWLLMGKSQDTCNKAFYLSYHPPGFRAKVFQFIDSTVTTSATRLPTIALLSSKNVH